MTDGGYVGGRGRMMFEMVAVMAVWWSLLRLELVASLEVATVMKADGNLPEWDGAIGGGDMVELQFVDAVG
ncbi:hypothetical protein LIER_41633 [Lithospermum erythrorhizon]|uniref:Peptidylprolyl isomerase n=1 Tax=Lithospermum erythrorhizon TaxID=34254 RepID=A0AAV3RC49_LITER